MIELDRAEAWEPPERPGWPRRLPVRSVAVVAVLTAVLAVVAGAAPVVRLAPPVVMPGDGIGDLRIDGDALYMLRRLDPANAVVESYRTSDGVLRWSAPVGVNSQFVDVARGRVVLTELRVGAATTHSLIALDAGSGSPVWSKPDVAPALYGSAGGTGVVLAEPYREGTEPLQGTGELFGVDIVTGAVRWSLRNAEGTVRSYVSVGDDVMRTVVQIAEFDPAGGLRLRSVETGTVVQTVTLDRPDRVDGFEIAGDRLLAYRSGERDGQRGMQAVTVFDMGTGARLWQRSADPAGEPFWWWWCGRILCAGTEAATTALDPGTGRELWHLSGWTDLFPLDRNRFLATRSEPAGAPVTGGVVLDVETGAVVRQVADWDLVSLPALPTVLLSSRSSTGEVRLARFDIDTGTLTVFGRVERWAVPPHCVATTAVLACAHGSVVSMWRLPRGTNRR